MSQRLRSIDVNVNVLGQMGSTAAMKIIQQDDQSQIATASESLSKDLIDQLTSLNPGEAIFTGQWVNIPAFVKVQEVKDRKIGVDLGLVAELEQQREFKEKTKSETSKAYTPEGYIDEQ